MFGRLAFVADFGTQNIHLKIKFDMENNNTINHENGNDANRLLPTVASPLEATSNVKVCRLKTNNYATKDYWIITDGWNVTICKQRNGESAEESITIPLKDFNRLIKWYVKPQKLPSNGS